MFKMSKNWSMSRMNFAIPSISAVPLCSMSLPMVSLNIWKCCNRNTLVTLFPNLKGDNVLNKWHFFSLIGLTMPFDIHCTKTSINQLCISVDSCVINGIRYLCSQIYHHFLLGRWVQVNWSQFGQDAQHPPQPIIPVCVEVVHVTKVNPQIVRPIVLKGRNIKCLYLFVEQRNIISSTYNFSFF